MKSLNEKRMLVKFAKMLGQPIDPALLESIEKEERLSKMMFGFVEPEAPTSIEKQIEIVEEVPVIEEVPEPVVEEIPEPVIEEILEPVVEAIKPPSPDVAQTGVDQIRGIDRKDLINQTVNAISNTKFTDKDDKVETLGSKLQNSELNSLKKQIANIMSRLGTLAMGGGGTGIVRLGAADDFDSSTYAEGRYLRWINGAFRLDDATGGAQGAQGATGAQGVQGSIGAQGAQGANGISSNLFLYQGKTNATSGYPGDGHILWNTDPQVNSNNILISHLTDDGNDIDVFLALLSVTQQFIIQDRNNSANYQIWQVSGTPTNTNPGAANSYWTYPVILISSGGTGTSNFSNNHSLFLAITSGILGPQGPQGVQGATGAQGVQGSIGTQGVQGAAWGLRVVNYADATSITINADTTELATQTNTQAVGTLTINAPTGTLSDGQKLMIRMQSTNVQTFSWNAIFAGSSDLTLPSVSSGSGKYDYFGFIYNSTASKWHLIASVSGF
jgi:hypothetical protein